MSTADIVGAKRKTNGTSRRFDVFPKKNEVLSEPYYFEIVDYNRNHHQIIRAFLYKSINSPWECTERGYMGVDGVQLVDEDDDSVDEPPPLLDVIVGRPCPWCWACGVLLRQQQGLGVNL